MADNRASFDTHTARWTSKGTLVALNCRECNKIHLLAHIDYDGSNPFKTLPCPECGTVTSSHNEVSLKEGDYRVVCRDDRETPDTKGDPVLATRKCFRTESQARAYFKSISNTRWPELLLVIDYR